MATSKSFSGIRAILLIIVCLELVNQSIGDQIYCGSKLRDVIQMMCPNGVDRYRIKRKQLSFDGESNEDLSFEETEDFFDFGLSLDMLPKLVQMENNGLAKLRRRRHGIVKECCSKPCSTGEVATFCALTNLNHRNL